ncbi:MAG: rod-binding protein [Gemmatimonadaceae bacterium]
MSASVRIGSQEERLRKVVGQLQGVFVEQLFKAMRETVPDDGITNGGPGEEMFTGMLDQHVASQTPAQWQHGLGDALFRQLRPALEPPSGATPAESAAANSTSKGIDR